MSTPHLDLTRSPHDRQGLRRTDDAWLEETWARPDTRVLVVAGTRILPGPRGPQWVSPDAAPAGIRVHLGELAGVAHWAVIADSSLAVDGWLPLRGLLPQLAEADLDDGAVPLLFHALGIAEWHWVTRHCPRCGASLEARAAGHELHCTGCGKPQFPRTDPAVIMVIAAGEPGSTEERALLGRHPAWPPGRYSTLAGFCEPGETLEDAVRREVHEETGVVVGDVDYYGNQPWPLPASLMLGFVGRATSETIVLDDDEVEDARWFTREQMRLEAEAGTLVLPGGVSISRSLIEHWYGGPLPGAW